MKWTIRALSSFLWGGGGISLPVCTCWQCWDASFSTMSLFLCLLDILKSLILLIFKKKKKAFCRRLQKRNLCLVDSCSQMRRAKWVWRLPECSIIVMRLCSSEQLKMQEPCLFWDPSQITIVESSSLNHRHIVAAWRPPIPLPLPGYYFKRKSQLRHYAQPYDQFITRRPSIRG